MKENCQRQRFLSTEEFQLAYDYVKGFPQMKEIGLFYMGESGLHPYLAWFYQKVKQDGFFTFLTTNGTCLQTIIEAIPYIDSLKVSWNYRDARDFCKKTGSPAGYYQRIQQNIQAFYETCHAYGRNLAISTILDDEKDAYDQALSEIPHDEHYWIPLQSQGGTQSQGLDGVVGESSLPSSPIPCWSLFKGIYVDSELNVRTCCYGHKPEHILGNLKTDKKIRNKDSFKSQHLHHEIPAICRDCLRHT